MEEISPSSYTSRVRSSLDHRLLFPVCNAYFSKAITRDLLHRMLSSRRALIVRRRAFIVNAIETAIRDCERRMVLSHNDLLSHDDDDPAIDAAACDFIRHPVSKRRKRMLLQEQHRTQKRRYEALMEDICGKKLSSEGFEKLFRKAELFQLIMGFKGEYQEISFEEFCWRRDLLAKLMKQKGNSPAAAGETSNTVRSRRVQFSAASHCHCNNLGHQPGGSDYYSVPRNNNMMNLGGVPGGNGQAEVGRPNYGTDNGGGNDQMIGIQPYQGYGGGNNTNGVTGNGMGVGQFPSNVNNIRGGSGYNINNVGAGHGGHGMGAGRLPSIGNNIGGTSVDGTGNGNGQAEVGRPNYGTDNGGGNDQMIGIQPYQGYGGVNNTNGVTGNGMGVGQFPSNVNNIRGGSGDNINNVGAGHGGHGMGAGRLPSIGNNIGGTGVDGTGNGNGQAEVGRPNYGTDNGGGNDQMIGIQPYQGYGGVNNTNGVTGNGMGVGQFPSNVNNIRGGSGDNINNVGAGRGGHGLGAGHLPSIGNNIGGTSVDGTGNGNGQAEVGRPNYGTNNGGGNDQMIGIQPYQCYGGGNNANNVTGNDMGIGQFPSNGNNIRGGSGDNINNIRGSHGGDRTGATHLPSIGNIGGNSVDGTGTNINNIAGYGMVIVEDPPNGNNVQGSGVDASGDIGGGHGGNGVGRALFPSTGNNTGGSGVFGSDLRLPSELLGGSINDWNDAELSDEELWLDLPEIDEFVN